MYKNKLREATRELFVNTPNIDMFDKLNSNIDIIGCILYFLY